MKKRATMPVIAVILVISIFVLAYNLIKASNHGNNSLDMAQVATVNNPITSPSGRYQIKVIEESIDGVKQNRFAVHRVLNGTPELEPIFTSPDSFRIRDTLYIIWDENDRIWVYSGDVGTYFWERVSDANWQKYAYADAKTVPVPALLKELKPGYFD